MPGGVRKIGVHKAVCAGVVTDMAIVVLEGDRVVDVKHFATEQAFTEWRGGTAVVEKGADGVARVKFYDGLTDGGEI